MNTSLTTVGYPWSFFSLISAGITAVGYYLPFWLIEGYTCIYSEEDANHTSRVTQDRSGRFCSHVNFGPFRRCGFPRRTSYGFDMVSDQCGRYKEFQSIPSPYWKATTVLVGVGTGLSLTIAIISIPACCLKNVITRGTGRLFGAIQFFSGTSVLVGCAIFPVGWGNEEVKDVCGYESGVYTLGQRTWRHLDDEEISSKPK